MGKYINGLIGGFIGGLIASIPWILLYVYGGFMISILAGIIAAGVNYGYRLFSGPVDSNLPKIIKIMSLLIVFIVTLYVIPALIIVQEVGILLNPYGIFLVFSEIGVSELAFDLIIALVFTWLGIKSVINKVEQEIL
jgi:hypothetical protein